MLKFKFKFKIFLSIVGILKVKAILLNGWFLLIGGVAACVA